MIELDFFWTCADYFFWTCIGNLLIFHDSTAEVAALSMGANSATELVQAELQELQSLLDARREQAFFLLTHVADGLVCSRTMKVGRLLCRIEPRARTLSTSAHDIVNNMT